MPASPAVYSVEEASLEMMRILLSVLVVQSLIGSASAALKPIEKDIRPVDNEAQ
jgi:hypothetical protein